MRGEVWIELLALVFSPHRTAQCWMTNWDVGVSFGLSVIWGQRPCLTCSGPFSLVHFFVMQLWCTLTLGSLASVWRSEIDCARSWLWGWELFVPAFRRSEYLRLRLWFFSKSSWICTGWCSVHVFSYVSGFLDLFNLPFKLICPISPWSWPAMIIKM